jgi:hypothetical protein
MTLSKRARLLAVRVCSNMGNDFPRITLTKFIPLQLVAIASGAFAQTQLTNCRLPQKRLDFRGFTHHFHFRIGAAGILAGGSPLRISVDS